MKVPARLNGRPVFDIEPLAFPSELMSDSSSFYEIMKFSPQFAGSLMIARNDYCPLSGHRRQTESRVSVFCKLDGLISVKGQNQILFLIYFYNTFYFFFFLQRFSFV